MTKSTASECDISCVKGGLACEQALWSGKERRKQRARTSEERGRGWGRKEGGGGGEGRKGIKIDNHKKTAGRFLSISGIT